MVFSFVLARYFPNKLSKGGVAALHSEQKQTDVLQHSFKRKARLINFVLYYSLGTAMRGLVAFLGKVCPHPQCGDETEHCELPQKKWKKTFTICTHLKSQCHGFYKVFVWYISFPTISAFFFVCPHFFRLHKKWACGREKIVEENILKTPKLAFLMQGVLQTLFLSFKT